MDIKMNTDKFTLAKIDSNNSKIVKPLDGDYSSYIASVYIDGMPLIRINDECYDRIEIFDSKIELYSDIVYSVIPILIDPTMYYISINHIPNPDGYDIMAAIIKRKENINDNSK